jgi:hypothetical protein
MQARTIVERRLGLWMGASLLALAGGILVAGRLF